MPEPEAWAVSWPMNALIERLQWEVSLDPTRTQEIVESFLVRTAEGGIWREDIASWAAERYKGIIDEKQLLTRIAVEHGL